MPASFGILAGLRKTHSLHAVTPLGSVRTSARWFNDFGARRVDFREGNGISQACSGCVAGFFQNRSKHAQVFKWFRPKLPKSRSDSHSSLRLTGR